MPQPGIVACLIVAIALLISVIGCGVARFDLATANEAAETALSVSADAEQADAVADALPSAHKTFDALAQHHRTLPHRMRSLTPSRWWHHTQAWPTARQHLDTGYAAAADICPSGRMLLTQFCISQR
ncbi:hypothetical protein PT015_01255 [Candidatus Mycobacterium wuenschmannii]|uniref:Flp pilus-assembly TadG-like N-terminal domain-containing protein n=1 Tax=Candidatus Mycobacterium wuenschmannii TaxID=3027808 RepID=A0ABY8VZM0_9MYCO|nr:hypothetical protein [Candidatus Mycobacterium wuenschmannii]WIM88182.1 hypothetical protein PT015_01255 [Candidatus Mycobacterium wuenschmannii]